MKEREYFTIDKLVCARHKTHKPIYLVINSEEHAEKLFNRQQEGYTFEDYTEEMQESEEILSYEILKELSISSDF